MRALVPVAIVGILAVTFLITFFIGRRRAVKRARLASAQARVRRAEGVLDVLRTEAHVQVLAGNSTHAYTASVLDAFFDKQELP